MGQRPLRILLLVCLCLLGACAGEVGGPRLVQEATVASPAESVTAPVIPVVSPTPFVIPVSTSELNVPLQVATINVDFVLVTPTLPPSKTPTSTMTFTPTVTATPPPTLTPTVTPTAIVVPTSVAVAQVTIAPPVQQPQQQVACSSPWFFGQPRPDTCPAGASFSSRASLEQFQQGYMIWIGEQDAIYVIYDSETQPRWQVFNDTFEDGMIEYDPGWGPGPPYTYQPKRGFGKLWRDRPDVRQRIGWSVREWSEPYTAEVQVAVDGSIFIRESRGGVFRLMGGGTDWKRYDGGF